MNTQNNERGTKIKTILKLHSDGKTKEEIIKLGFHKTTVNIQINKIKKNETK
jgi:hypothetical protein